MLERLAVSPWRRVKRRRALLASNPPRDNPVEGTPMGVEPLSRAIDQGLFFLSIGYLSHASENAPQRRRRRLPFPYTSAGVRPAND
jgi:hypothetical protein